MRGFATTIPRSKRGKVSGWLASTDRSESVRKVAVWRPHPRPARVVAGRRVAPHVEVGPPATFPFPMWRGSGSCTLSLAFGCHPTGVRLIGGRSRNGLVLLPRIGAFTFLDLPRGVERLAHGLQNQVGLLSTRLKDRLQNFLHQSIKFCIQTGDCLEHLSVQRICFGRMAVIFGSSRLGRRRLSRHGRGWAALPTLPCRDWCCGEFRRPFRVTPYLARQKGMLTRFLGFEHARRGCARASATFGSTPSTRIDRQPVDQVATRSL